MKTPLRSALENLHGLPSLDRTVFPGDRVLLVPDAEIALETGLLAEVAVTLLDLLREHGTEPGELSVLIDEAEEKAAGEALAAMLPEKVRLLVHRPERPGSLALLGVSAEDEPIALARDIAEYDLVVPVGRFYRRRPKDHFGLFTAIFPRFSGTETRKRFADAPGTARRRLAAEVDEVARRLGVLLAVQILRQKGKPDRIAAGLPDEVARFLGEDEFPPNKEPQV